MFPVSRPAAASIPEIKTLEECDVLFEQDLAIFFKHSATCPVSWMAHREVVRFKELEPSAPLYMIPVRQRREISHHVAAKTGVQHESPQIVVVREGRVLGSVSHDEVTASWLQSVIKAPAIA